MARFWDTLTAMGRQGAKDLHNNIVPAFPVYAHGVDEPGTPLNPHAAASPDAGFAAAVERQQERNRVVTAAKEQDRGVEL